MVGAARTLRVRLQPGPRISSGRPRCTVLLVVEQHFRKLNAPHLCAEVHAGVVYRDGARVVTPARDRAAA